MKQSLANRLTNQPVALDHLLSGISEEQIRQRPQTGKWSIFENLAHLGRYQEVFLERMQQITAEKTPAFSRYVADTDPGFTDWTQLPFSAIMDQITRGRVRLNAFLGSLEQAQLIRVGIHPVYGPMTIEGWTEFFLLHEGHHFFTILKLGGLLRSSEQPMGL